MENINTVENAVILDWIQISNSILASVSGLVLHSYILYRMLNKYTSLSEYQNLIVIQSVVGVLLAIVKLIANERETISGTRLTSFPFLPFDKVTEKIVLSLNAALYSLEQFLIVIFNIHRMLMFMRNRWIKKFYIVFTPFVLIYTVVFSIAASLPVEPVKTVMQLIFVPSVLITSIVCYIFINRYFRSNSGYTVKVKQMQARFSTSIFIEAVIHGMLVLSWMLVVPLSLFFKWIISGNETIAIALTIIYSLILIEPRNDIRSTPPRPEWQSRCRIMEARFFLDLINLIETFLLMSLGNYYCMHIRIFVATAGRTEFQIVLLASRWYSFAIGALTLWSIYGLLRKQNSHRPDLLSECNRVFSISRRQRNRCAPGTI